MPGSLSKVGQAVPAFVGSAPRWLWVSAVLGLTAAASAAMFRYRNPAAASLLWSLTRSYVGLPLSNVRTPMPSSTQLDAAWMTGVLRRSGAIDDTVTVVAVADDGALSGGLVGSLRRFRVTYECSTGAVPATAPPTVIFKSISRNLQAFVSSNMLGTAREAVFFNNFVGTTQAQRDNLSYGELSTSALLSEVVPFAYHAHGSMFAGDYTILMEDLGADNGVLCAQLLGNQHQGFATPGENPLVDRCIAAMSPVECTARVLISLARVHAQFWNDASLFQHAFFRGADWRRGYGRGSWECVASIATTGWTQGGPAALGAISESAGHPAASLQDLSRVISASVAAVGWDAVQEHLAAARERHAPFTLTHGDFHAKNISFKQDPQGKWRPCVFDWAMVGVGHPMADVTQFFISDVPIEVRRAHEKDLVRGYWRTLCECASLDHQEYEWDQCWHDYCAGDGVGRFVWMMAILSQFRQIPDLVYFLGTQLQAFIQDHKDEHRDDVYLITCM